MGKKISYHILFWIAFFLIIELLFTIRISGQVIGADSVVTTNFRLRPYRLQLMGLPLKVFFFYINLLVFLPAYLKKKNMLAYTAKLIMLAGFCYLIDYFVVNEIYLKNPLASMVITESYQFYLNKMLPLFYLLIFGISTSYFFIRQWIENEKQKRELISMQLNSELTLLKYQINPHFLFNTLNNLFSIAQKHELPELENGIAKLSGMMRFMIYESNTEDIPLAKEVQYIKDFIDIYKLRIDNSDNSHLSFTINGDIDKQKIAPFLLIPLVENSVKHGINFKYPSSVKINLNSLKNGIEFTIINTNHSQTKTSLDDTSGIGLKNVKRRLELIYPRKHEFNTTSENGYYITNLSINLS